MVLSMTLKLDPSDLPEYARRLGIDIKPGAKVTQNDIAEKFFNRDETEGNVDPAAALAVIVLFVIFIVLLLSI